MDKKYCFSFLGDQVFIPGTKTIEGTLKSAFDLAKGRYFKDGELIVMIGELENLHSNKVIKIKEFKLNEKGKMIL